MTDGGAQASANLGAILHSATPSDDAGAQTLDRYEWQAMMATIDLLALYLDAVDAGREPSSVSDCGLVCEYHEDWARIRADDVQLVSGKHKEPRFGAFTTVTSLLDEGGVYHLFDRWLLLGGVMGCRLVTTAGLDSDAALIHGLCAHFATHSTHVPFQDEHAETAYVRLVDGLAKRRTEAGLDDVPELQSSVLPHFLSRLVVDHGCARREHMPALAPTAYAEPVARAIGRQDLAVPIWEAVLALVRGRMRAAGPARRGLLPSLALVGEDDLERRTVSVADAHVAIMAALATPGGFTPLPRVMITNRMAVKMTQGRCAATSIERAEILRRRFTSWRRDQRSEPGGRESELDLDLLLRRVADHATATARTDGAPWGAALWGEVEDQLALEVDKGAARGLDTDMLLGGLSELANNCKVWYSEPFNAKDRLDAIRTEHV